MRSKSGGIHVANGIKSDGSEADIYGNDREKNLILRDGEKYPFLVKLGVSDGNGRVYDRKRAKFRQINKFLENVRDIYPLLPKEGELYVLDLCCGKSYLTFAVYYYLTVLCGRRVNMRGMDLKPDVIEYCSKTAEELDYSGLSFECGDIRKIRCERAPDLVLSLHACDVATDIVLDTASREGAKVILSTPCCHHELMHTLDGSSEMGDKLKDVIKYSLLKQKLCDALTDALRCKLLEAKGYSVTVTELIDPEETPKNLMIRAVKTGIGKEKAERLYREYEEMKKYIIG